MKNSMLLSRRDFVTTVSALTLASMLLPKAVGERAAGQDEFVVVNGWVLKRSEAA
jgi:hypothetical protein